jgi:L-amino acid N-acyltransferase YncA
MSVTIRMATGADAARCAGIYRPFVDATAISFETEAPDESEMRRRIIETRRVYPWLVCEHRGVVVGYAYAGSHKARAAYRWSVDVSVYVDIAFQRHGIGRGLYTSLIRLLVAQGFVNAYAGITLPNAASTALHESVGFRRVGVYHNVGYKLGAWHDVGWWELGLQPHRVPVSEPLDVRVVAQDPASAALVSAGLPLIHLGNAR